MQSNNHPISLSDAAVDVATSTNHAGPSRAPSRPVGLKAKHTSNSKQITITTTATRPSTPVLERQTSRLSNALTHVRSIEAYPPPDRDDDDEAVGDVAGGVEREDDDDDEQSHSGNHEELNGGTGGKKKSGSWFKLRTQKGKPRGEPIPITMTKGDDDRLPKTTSIAEKDQGNQAVQGEQGDQKGALQNTQTQQGQTQTKTQTHAHGGIAAVDIEHVPVDDDPREWKSGKKWFALMIVTFGLLGPVMAASIYNPVINGLAEELHATEAEIGLSLSMYILFQGIMPVLWAAISEPSYLVSYAIYVVALIVASRAKDMSVLIGMRVLQAVGSGAVTACGAGSLADMYEMHERGEKMGLFYGIPMLGPGVAPLLGGALGQAFGWRSVFYFLAAYAGVMECFFIFFPDSWRRERSRVYQKAIKGALKRAEANERRKIKRQAKKANAGNNNKISQGSKTLDTIPASPSESRRPSDVDNQGPPAETEVVGVELDPHGGANEKGQVKLQTRRKWFGIGFGRVKERRGESKEDVKLSLRDLNPLPTMVSVLKKPTNALILTASGLLYAAQYTIVYTASITLGAAPYEYDSLKIGLVLLAFGVGNIGASIFGGRYSDVVLRRLKKANGGIGVAEMRLKATFVAMPFLVLGFLMYAWFAEKTIHVAAIVVSLFISGFALLWIYSSTLAYLVDANPGVSASAVSLNSMFRGIMACVMSQIAVPIRNAIGDGGLYTLFAGLLALSSAIMVLLAYRGEEWRSPGHRFSWRFWESSKDKEGK
ncbi:hypothetical protein IAT40_006161 [Kwoniella sp. CBS 6097]